ncbi:MAG: HD domain-containing protein [Bacteroidia bacterium]|nr:HD domain-containing protein [Bacteroidia bacterium]
MNYKKAEHFIVKLLDSKLPPGLFYHGLHHTLDVCKSVEEIALAEGIDGEDLHILKTAALFHDAGFTKQYTANEVIGCEMANETLPQFGYSPKQIKMVEELILATIVPQNPKNHLEQIICDADLDYLGRNAEEFYSIAQTLFEELKAFGKINDPIKWDEIQVNFLSAHKYFTKTNVERRRDSKVKRIEEIKNRLSKLKDNNANPST